MRTIVTLLRGLLPLLALFLFAPAVQAAPCQADCLAPGDYDLQMNSGG